MNQKINKPISEFTDKQLEAYKTAMEEAKKPLNRRQLYFKIREERIYENNRDIREVAKMLVKNPNTSLELNSDRKVINTVGVV